MPKPKIPQHWRDKVFTLLAAREEPVQLRCPQPHAYGITVGT